MHDLFENLSYPNRLFSHQIARIGPLLTRSRFRRFAAILKPIRELSFFILFLAIIAMDMMRCMTFIPAMCAQTPSRQRWRRAAATTALTAYMLTTGLQPERVMLPAHATDSRTTATTAITTPISKSDAQHALLEEAWKIVDKYFYNVKFNGVDWEREREQLQSTTLKSSTDTYVALRRAVKKLGDRYTRVLDPQQMTALRKYDVSGVGLLLTENESGELIVVMDPAGDSAAGKAGVRRGDIVEAIDGRSVKGVDAFTVAEWMQGAEGSQMQVRFRNQGETTLVRQFSTAGAAPAVGRAVLVDRADGRMGYIRLDNFTASSRNDMARALREARAGGAEWVVLDLRGNGGGIFEGALEIAGLFEGDGVPVVQVRGRQDANMTNATDGLRESYVSRIIGSTAADAWDDVDVAILINKSSASSSEVLAGGLRDSCKAALVGQRSFGKGLIQGVFGLSDGGGLIVTVAEYRTPLGKKIDGVGLDVDLSLKLSGFEQILKTIGLERFTEHGLTLSHDDVREVLRLCRENEHAGNSIAR